MLGWKIISYCALCSGKGFISIDQYLTELSWEEYRNLFAFLSCRSIHLVHNHLEIMKENT